MWPKCPWLWTLNAFQKSCELYNQEVQQREYSVSGFRKSAKLSPNYLYQLFGDQVEQLCCSLLGEAIQDQCELTGDMREKIDA